MSENIQILWQKWSAPKKIQNGGQKPRWRRMTFF